MDDYLVIGGCYVGGSAPDNDAADLLGHAFDIGGTELHGGQGFHKVGSAACARDRPRTCLWYLKARGGDDRDDKEGNLVSGNAAD